MRGANTGINNAMDYAFGPGVKKDTPKPSAPTMPDL
jgi:hypothetical protein